MRLSDFSDWQVLRVTCTRCKHAVLLAPKVLYRAAKSSPAMSLKALECSVAPLAHAKGEVENRNRAQAGCWGLKRLG